MLMLIVALVISYQMCKQGDVCKWTSLSLGWNRFDVWTQARYGVQKNDYYMTILSGKSTKSGNPNHTTEEQKHSDCSRLHLVYSENAHLICLMSFFQMAGKQISSKIYGSYTSTCLLQHNITSVLYFRGWKFYCVLILL